MAQKLEHLGLIVFIDVPTQLPDRIVLCQRGPSYPCSTSYERYIETLLQGAIHLLSLYLTSLLCSSGLAIRDGCFTLSACPRVIFCKGRREQFNPLSPIYTNLNPRMTFLSHTIPHCCAGRPTTSTIASADTAPTIHVPY
jgi:hypothetical protein